MYKTPTLVQAMKPSNDCYYSFSGTAKEKLPSTVTRPVRIARQGSNKRTKQPTPCWCRFQGLLPVPSMQQHEHKRKTEIKEENERKKRDTIDGKVDGPLYAHAPATPYGV